MPYRFRTSLRDTQSNSRHESTSTCKELYLSVEQPCTRTPPSALHRASWPRSTQSSESGKSIKFTLPSSFLKLSFTIHSFIHTFITPYWLVQYNFDITYSFNIIKLDSFIHYHALLQADPLSADLPATASRTHSVSQSVTNSLTHSLTHSRTYTHFPTTNRPQPTQQ